jgi:hypothetical protein
MLVAMKVLEVAAWKVAWKVDSMDVALVARLVDNLAALKVRLLVL